jgi:hypothetical protein
LPESRHGHTKVIVLTGGIIMGRKIALTLVFASFWIAASICQQPVKPKQDAPDIATASRSNRLLLQQIGVATALQDNACEDCAHAIEEGGKCYEQMSACKGGSVKACYLAAACACQCQLDAGGCGSDRDALKECVEKNEKLAQDLD